MVFFRSLIGFTVAIILTAFAVFNRQEVEVVLLPWEMPLAVPLYLIALVFMLAGFVFGGSFVWLNGSEVRSVKRKQAKELKAMEKELEQVNAESVMAGAAPASELFPMIQNKRKDARS